NIFRYRPISRVLVVVGVDATGPEVALVRDATDIVGVQRIERSVHDPVPDLARLGVHRVRFIGGAPPSALLEAAATAGVHVADQPVIEDGRIELLHYVREQAVSRSRHRFGNLLPS
ncbi:MAG: hypothetical protein AAGE98_12685, partial [Actinomycetota bacterium]